MTSENNVSSVELDARISMLSDSVVLYREIPEQTAFSCNYLFDRVAEKSAKLPTFRLIIDLSEAGRPGAEVKAQIEERVQGYTNLEQIYVVMGKNVLIRIAAKFMLARLMSLPIEIVGSLEEAQKLAGLDD